MARILKITSGLMGVLLLVMVGVMEFVRGGDQFRTAMLLRDESHFYMGLPEKASIFPLAQSVDGLGVLIGYADGWFFYAEETYWTGNVYRFRLTGRREKILKDVYVSAADTLEIAIDPTSKSILYVLEDEHGGWKLYGADLDGSHAQNLLSDYPDVVKQSVWPYQFSRDGKLLIFDARNHLKDQWDGYITDLKTGETRRLEASDQTRMVTDYWPQKEDWFIAGGDGLFQYTTDGVPPRRLTFPKADVWTSAVAWNRFAQLLVVIARDSMGQTPYTMSGVSIQDAPEVMWSISYADYIGASPDGEWVFVTNPLIADDSLADNTVGRLKVERIQVRTGERETILQLLNPNSWAFFDLSTDGKWLLATSYHGDAGPSLICLDLQTLSYDFLGLPDGYFGALETSPDGQYAEFYNRDLNSTIIVHLPTLSVREIRGKWLSTWFTLPETHHSTAGLLLGGLAFITMPTLISPLRRRFHPATNI
ncbi:MAG: hypothetical protein K8L91_19350 [Anaerolineae bacterium]|nr:hypothetical protein [Anaerolineae bacterium]